jgi:hypothetical protein
MAWDESTRSALLRAKEQVLQQHGDDPNVNGAGIGLRTRAGELTDEPVVVVFVIKKRPEALVPRARLLPRSIEVDGRTWGVDVVETGHVVTGVGGGAGAAVLDRHTAALLQPQGLPIDERMRPPRQGASVGSLQFGGAGTYSCTVRDLTDGTMCVLSCNHVLAGNDQGVAGQVIVQPGALDGGTAADRIARLRRFHPIGTATEVDAAIAQLDDQAGFTDLVARDLMAPISPDHRAVGMLVAGGLGRSFLAVMDTTLDALDIELVGATPTDRATAPATPGMAVEKVGRTTGYTSSVVGATNVDINVRIEPGRTVRYENLIMVPRLSCPGDSGSIVCQGGNGSTLAPVCECVALETVGDYYDLPLTEDEDLADQVRDEFLAQSETGYLLVSAIYGNPELVHRLEEREVTDWETSYAQEYYDKYHDFVAAVLADPDSDAVLTQEHLDDIAFILFGLTNPTTGIEPVLTPEESDVAWALYDEVLTPALGMDRRQIVAHMNDPAVYQTVHDRLRTVPTIDLNRPVVTRDGPR